MRSRTESALSQALQGTGADRATALVLTHKAVELDDVLQAANHVSKSIWGRSTSLCSIVNARSGACSEDCRFCAQSVHYATEALEYPLLSPDEVLTAARTAQESRSACFGIVTSGKGLPDALLQPLCEILTALRRDYPALELGGSFGVLTADQLHALQQAGMTRYNHNLETSRRFFPQVTTTHSYDERLQTVRLVRDAGMPICCGGIFGLGETWEDRVDLFLELRNLGVESVPLNFLHPIPGTPLEHARPLAPDEILRTIAIARLVLPRSGLRICGGREINLRDLRSWIFYAGATGMMVGNYLTTPGRGIDDDLAMIEDLQRTLVSSVDLDRLRDVTLT